MLVNLQQQKNEKKTKNNYFNNKNIQLFAITRVLKANI